MREEIDKEIKQAFDSDLSDAVKSFTGECKELNQSLNDWIGNDVEEIHAVSYSGRGVFSGYSVVEIMTRSVSQTDVKLICLQSEVTRAPAIDDVIIEGDNKYQVVSLFKDPVDATYTIQLRRV